MYIPKAFNVEEWGMIEDTIIKYPFVDILGILDGKILISKNPIIYNGNKEFNFHLAKGNPLVKVIGDVNTIDVLISGPHNYISPKWYRASPAVPTWNYVAIQISLSCQLVNDKEWLLKHHQDLTTKFEKNGWENSLPDEFRDKLNGMIVGVVGHVLSFEAKYKLGQNRSDEDFTGIYNGLRSNKQDDELANCMRHLFPRKLLDK
jgi:transcriptional regulator